MHADSNCKKLMEPKKAMVKFKTNWWVSLQHVFSDSFFKNILMDR